MKYELGNALLSSLGITVYLNMIVRLGSVSRCD